MANYFFIDGNGQQQGPFTPEQLLQYGVHSETPVWAEGMPDWTAAGNIPELNALFASAYAQPAAAPTSAPVDESESSNILVKYVRKILGTIDDGSFFRRPLYWMYIIFYCLLALSLVGVGIILMVLAVDDYSMKGTFGEFGTYIFGILALLVCWAMAAYTIVFGLNRAKKLNALTNANDEIFVIPLVAYCYQTFREWLGTTIMIGGTALGLVVAVVGLLSFQDKCLYTFLGGLALAVGCILGGYLIVFLGHFIANFLTGFASLVNNMKRTEINTRK